MSNTLLFNIIKLARLHNSRPYNLTKKRFSCKKRSYLSVSQYEPITVNLHKEFHVFLPPLMCKFSSSVPDSLFEEACHETLESLTEFFEDLVESHGVFASGDVSYSDGVLTINLGNKFGTYVINRQSPNKQIWLSSPISGPKRYDFVEGHSWVYKHDKQPLHWLLQNELSEMLGKQVNLSQCSYFTKSKEH